MACEGFCDPLCAFVGGECGAGIPLFWCCRKANVMRMLGWMIDSFGDGWIIEWGFSVTDWAPGWRLPSSGQGRVDCGIQEEALRWSPRQRKKAEVDWSGVGGGAGTAKGWVKRAILSSCRGRIAGGGSDDVLSTRVFGRANGMRQRNGAGACARDGSESGGRRQWDTIGQCSEGK